MSTTSSYTVRADWFGDAPEVALQVNFDILTPELAAEINDFWTGAEDRLSAEEGNVLLTVIRMFGEAAIRYFMESGGASFGPTDDPFHTAAVIEHQHEGWPTVEDLGILITAAEVSVVDYYDVTLEAV